MVAISAANLWILNASHLSLRQAPQQQQQQHLFWMYLLFIFEILSASYSSLEEAPHHQDASAIRVLKKHGALAAILW
jgi:hypothetical protein